MTTHDDLPLFQWKPSCQVMAFPPVKRVGKVRDVAEKWLGQRTLRQAETYAIRIDRDLRRHLASLQLAGSEIDDMTEAFWMAVRSEIARLRYAGQDDGRRPGGAA